VSLGLPFGLGWAIGGWHGALTALLWAGLVRVTLLQHVRADGISAMAQ
jgi:stearoyl-CoA desaturase (delta-9 desaturase)